MIRRENFEITAETVVCEKYFASEFIMHVDTITRDYGSTLSVHRTLPKLSLDAFPSYFPNAPSFLSIELPVKRKSSDIEKLK